MTFATDRLVRPPYRFDPYFEGAVYTDLGMSDEFDSTTLDAQWTAVNIASGTADLLAASTITDPVYDLTSHPGVLLVQAGASDDCGFRVDDALANDEEICVGFGWGLPASGSNVFWPMIVFNDDDTDGLAGTEQGIGFDGSDDDRFLVASGNTLNLPGANATSPSGMLLMLRMVRSSDTLSGFISKNGTDWSVVFRADTWNVAWDNFWLWWNMGAIAEAAPVTAVHWVRHTAYVGRIPEWAR